MQLLEKGEYVGSIKNEFRENGLLASISSYEQRRFNNSWHCHVNAHISFVLMGGCSEKKKESYERLPGKATFYMSGEPHQIINMHNSTHINLEMDDSFFQHYGISESEFGKIVNKTPDAKFVMLKVYKELLSNDQFTAVSIHMLLLNFLKSTENCRDDKIPGWLKTVHSLLNDRWNETLRLEDLSAATGIHPVTISAHFPRYFSCTLGAYMRKLKVEKALALIKSSDASLTDIAYECGFFDQSHFIRTFKQFTGFLPARYQKMGH
jgi:AraC family transcriptional regulator